MHQNNPEAVVGISIGRQRRVQVLLKFIPLHIVAYTLRRLNRQSVTPHWPIREYSEREGEIE